ncbi:unnamed protein product [Macrosiphum euphorbiae]|uniref:Uncharacterized protein n=1 Tax=Macrosiphum euphorbiae TaxID=13131 RepID=A0AAV0WQR9_9HEMI|nr:unnamed protein product [Macrosiphum euphorbiae]
MRSRTYSSLTFGHKTMTFAIKLSYKKKEPRNPRGLHRHQKATTSNDNGDMTTSCLCAVTLMKIASLADIVLDGKVKCT